MVVPDSPFTPAARRHILRMVRELAPHAARLERKLLKGDGVDGAQARELRRILPTAVTAVSRFPEQVQYHGQRLAKLNLPIERAAALLRQFDGRAAEALGGRCAPAREQLLLATLYTLHLAYYEVRESETQAFFGLYRAEREAADLDDLLRRFVEVLTRTFRARAGRLILSNDAVAPRPRYVERGAQGSSWIYPLRSPGTIELEFAKRYRWLPRELALLGAAAARCEEAIEWSRREGTIRRLEVQARTAEEEERRRMGRELHDEAGQSLMVLRLRLEMMEREAPEEFRGRVREAREMVEGTAVELRRIIAALSPAVLERLGLESAVRQLAGRFRRNHGAALRVRIALHGAAVAKPVQEVVYRVAQECLQNAAKHSGASHVNLSLRAADSKVRLRISDDGAGFRMERARLQPMSFGLAGMRERAALIGGSLAIRSAPSEGTTVTLELPRED